MLELNLDKKEFYRIFIPIEQYKKMFDLKEFDKSYQIKILFENDKYDYFFIAKKLVLKSKCGKYLVCSFPKNEMIYYTNINSNLIKHIKNVEQVEYINNCLYGYFNNKNISDGLINLDEDLKNML